MDKLFVYGIFLSEYARRDYHMGNPEYAVVEDYTTILMMPGSDIVAAIPLKGVALTGLLVDIPAVYLDPDRKGEEITWLDNWERLDQLEAGYDRIKVETVIGEEAYMYVMKNKSNKSNKSRK